MRWHGALYHMTNPAVWWHGALYHVTVPAVWWHGVAPRLLRGGDALARRGIYVGGSASCQVITSSPHITGRTLLWGTIIRLWAVVPTNQQQETIELGYLMEFGVLATSNVISGRVLICDIAHSWRLCNAALLGDQKASIVTSYATQSHYPDNEPINPCPILIMWAPG